MFVGEELFDHGLVDGGVEALLFLLPCLLQVGLVLLLGVVDLVAEGGVVLVALLPLLIIEFFHNYVKYLHPTTHHPPPRGWSWGGW